MPLSPPKPPAAPAYVQYQPNTIVVSQERHHYVRTILASLFGILALYLVIASFLAVWLNRTLTDTDTFVRTVAPLVVEPEIQDFVIDKASTQLLNSAEEPELAVVLLGTYDSGTMSGDELRAELRPVAETSVRKVLMSDNFIRAWNDTNRMAHASLVNQLQAGTSTLNLDLGPLIYEVTNELADTRLGPISSRVVLPDNAGIVRLSGSGFETFSKYHGWLQRGTPALLGAAALCVLLCIILSVNHAKTARRILMGTGLSALALALALNMPSLININGLSPIDKAAAVAFVRVILHDLVVALVVLGSACLLTAAGSKLYAVVRRRRRVQGPAV